MPRSFLRSSWPRIRAISFVIRKTSLRAVSIYLTITREF